MQLIQYAPATETVLKRPLLVFPPWINKFYILDLRPKNSFVRWAVEQGHTVFMVSWVNPDERLAGKGFDDYMREGVYAALDAVEKATGEKGVNAIGYCLGGTLLATTLAHMAAKGDDRVKTATYFVTMTDFEQAGELGVFIDEEQLRGSRTRCRSAATSKAARWRPPSTCSRERPHLVLRGEQLPARPGALPLRPALLERRQHAHAGEMHSFYLRRMYQQNDLVKPGAIELLGEPSTSARSRCRPT
jgi:polyhydroxyalkanoate synthase